MTSLYLPWEWNPFTFWLGHPCQSRFYLFHTCLPTWTPLLTHENPPVEHVCGSGVEGGIRVPALEALMGAGWAQGDPPPPPQAIEPHMWTTDPAEATVPKRSQAPFASPCRRTGTVGSASQALWLPYQCHILGNFVLNTIFAFQMLP